MALGTSLSFSESRLAQVSNPPPKQDVASRIAAQASDGITSLVRASVGSTEASVGGGLETNAKPYDPNNTYADPGKIAAVNNRNGQPFYSSSTRVDVASYALENQAAQDIQRHLRDTDIDQSLQLKRDLNKDAEIKEILQRKLQDVPSDEEQVDAAIEAEAQDAPPPPEIEDVPDTPEPAPKPVEPDTTAINTLNTVLGSYSTTDPSVTTEGTTTQSVDITV